MESIHIIEILILIVVSLIGFIGLRVYNQLDKLFDKIDEFEHGFDLKCDTVNKRLTGHAERIARIEGIAHKFHSEP